MRFWFVFLVIVCGCGRSPSDYVRTCESAKTAIPVARQMEEIFGTSAVRHWISARRRGLKEGQEEWQTYVCFPGRYELTMEVLIEVDYRKRMIKQVGKPKFQMNQIESLNFKGNSGPFGVSYDRLWTFSENKWAKVYEAKGDFSAAGIKLAPKPIKGFNIYQAYTVDTHLPVSLLR